MNYATHQTSRTTRLAVAVLSITITLALSAGIIYGMAGGLDASGAGTMAVKGAPQVVAGR